MSAQKKEMITIDTGIEIAKSDLIDTFSDQELIEPYLKMVRDAVTVSESEINLATDKGRKEIASRAHKVSKIKTALIKAGKDSVSELRKQVADVNSGVKYIESELDNLRDTTRQPLTLWQQEQDRIEEERIKAISIKIEGIRELGVVHGDETIEQISSMIEAVDNIDCSEGFDEMTQDAMKTISEAKSNLSLAMQNLIEKARAEEAQRKIDEERAAYLIQERINKLKMIPLDLTGNSSSEIQAKIDSLNNYHPSEEFGEKLGEAKLAHEMVIKQLDIMAAQALMIEQAEAKLKETEDLAIAENAHKSISDKDGNLPPPIENQTINSAIDSAIYKAEEPDASDPIKDTRQFHDIVEFLMVEIEMDSLTEAEIIARSLILNEVPHVSLNRQTKAA